jgi:hypothetical protein
MLAFYKLKGFQIKDDVRQGRCEGTEFVQVCIRQNV